MGDDFAERCRQLLERQAGNKARKVIERGLRTLARRGVCSYESLCEALLKPKPHAVYAALLLLESFGKRKAVPVLLRLLLQHDALIRWEAAKSLLRLDGSLVVRGCLSLLKRETTAEAREAAAYVLSFSHDQRAVPDLLRVFSDARDATAVRAQAAEGLGNLLHLTRRNSRVWRQAAEALCAGLAAPQPEIRFWAAFALGTLRVESAAPKLETLAAGDTARCPGWWTVGEEASAALTAIRTGYWPAVLRKTTNSNSN